MHNIVFVQNVVNVWGEDGQAWLQRLPKLVENLAAKWQLSNLVPYSNLSYNYVLTGYLPDQTKVVLKIGFDVEEVKRESLALIFYSGHGCVRLLGHDIEYGAMLIELIEPGSSLTALFPGDDNLALKTCAEVIKCLHSKPFSREYDFPDINSWLQALYKPDTDVLPENIIKKARELSNYLLNTQGQPVLLHGDLHHGNILASGHDNLWVAIDPKGVIGEAEYEIGAFIRNPIPDIYTYAHSRAIISDRLSAFADILGMDRKRLRDWSYVQAVLSACWMAEEKEAWQDMLAIAEIIEKA